MSSRMTAMEENTANQLNDSVNLAIHKVMGQDCQSYEDFIGGFQHISKDTAILNKKSADQCPRDKEKPDGHFSCIQEQKKEHSKSYLPMDIKQTQIGQFSYLDNDEELEEEMLESGTVVTSEHTARVKVDNFVDDEDADIEISGYVASFSCDLPKEKVDKTENDIAFMTISDTVNIKTDILSNNETDHKSGSTVDVEEPDSVSEVVVEHICPKDTKSDGGTSEEDNIEQVTIGTGHMTLYPGEADPTLEVPTEEITNHTHLEFTTTKLEYVPSTVLVSSESCTDEVQPFSLDLEFDYDNVILTPKFTMQEIEHLKSFLP